MKSTDENALLCDLAETYHIYDYRSLPAFRIAAFSAGLRDDSRIKTKLRGETIPQNTMLLALLHDRITDVLWCLGAYEKQPEYLIDRLLGKSDKKLSTGFNTPEEFHKARSRFIKQED